MAKQPTPQGISALLRRSGFERSETKKGRIRGFREWTEGFTATKHYPDGVVVEWQPSSLRAHSDNDERQREMLDRYRKVIEDAGYVVADGSTALTAKLLVTAKEA
jgi:hypothetical protein